MVLGSKGKAAVVHWAPLMLQNSHPDQPVIAQLQESLQKSLHHITSIALCHHAFEMCHLIVTAIPKTAVKKYPSTNRNQHPPTAADLGAAE